MCLRRSKLKVRVKRKTEVETWIVPAVSKYNISSEFRASRTKAEVDSHASVGVFTKCVHARPGASCVGEGGPSDGAHLGVRLLQF